MVDQLDGGNVARMLQRGAQGDQSPVVPLVVLRLVEAAGVRIDKDGRLVVDQIGRGQSLLQGGGVQDRLEGRADRAARLDRSIVLAPLEVVAAHEGADRSASWIEHHHRALHVRLLIQEHAHRVVRLGRAGNLEQRHVSPLQQAGKVVGAGPCGVARGERAGAAPRKADPRLAGGDGQHHAPHDIALHGRAGILQAVPLVGLDPWLGEDVLGHGSEASPAVDLAQVAPQDLLGQFLEPWVEGGVDLEAVLVDGLIAEAVGQILADLLQEVTPETVQIVAFPARPERPVRCGLALGRCDVPLGDHAAQNDVAASPRPFGIAER